MAARRTARFDNKPTVNTTSPYDNGPGERSYPSEDEGSEQAAEDVPTYDKTPLGNDY